MQKYSIFISSCFETLREERKLTIDAVLKMGAFPVAMEHFSANNFENIKLWIETSDAVILLLGGEYGSVDPAGVSWTEREYRYAVEHGIHVFPVELPSFSELRAKPDPTDAEQKQLAFAKTVNQTYYLCPVKQPSEFYEKISQHFLLDETFKANAVGWERRVDQTKWQKEHPAFQLSGEWYSFHVSNADPTYLRIGKAVFSQCFTSKEFRELEVKAKNFNAYFDPETRAIREDIAKCTRFEGDYEIYLDPFGDEIDKVVGIFSASRNFKGTFADQLVASDTTNGIHIFDTFYYAEDGSIKAIIGSFANAGSSKRGEIALFRTVEDRNDFLLENFLPVLKNNVREK